MIINNIIFNENNIKVEQVILISNMSYTGRVKWFNSKAGYGFITITDGPKSGTDVFVHHSAIKVESEQYKYLVQGEYVDFSLADTTSGNHEFQASQVGGIKGGKLMCETRRETKVSRVHNHKEPEKVQESPPPVKRNVGRGRPPKIPKQL